MWHFKNLRLSFYSILLNLISHIDCEQDALVNVKQQCSEFYMTRNVQCRETIEQVQRQIAGLNFASEGETSYNFPSWQSNSPSSQPPDPSHPAPHPQTPIEQPVHGYSHPYSFAAQLNHQTTSPSLALPPYNHIVEQPRPGYSHPYPAYPAPQLPPYYASGNKYQHPQQAPNHEYRQPTYPGWHGPYYDAYQQQPGRPGPYLAPPYSVPAPYPPRQGSHQRP